MIQFPTLIKKFCDALLEYDPETKKLYWYHSERKPDLCNRWSDHEEIYEMYRERYVCRDDLDIWERFLSPENMSGLLKETQRRSIFISALKIWEGGWNGTKSPWSRWRIPMF